MVMINLLNKIPKGATSTWALISGVVIGGTVLKVGYFAFVRDIFEKDAEKINQDGMKRIQEAREYAHKKAQEREQVMPDLSPEQEQQMRQYLQMVGQHGMTKLTQISDQEECLNCPMLSKFPLKPPSK